MNFLISLLGACFGIILAIVIIVIIIYLKIRKEVGGSNMKILTNARVLNTFFNKKSLQALKMLNFFVKFLQKILRDFS